MTKILINGVKGKMGKVTAKAIQNEKDLQLVGQTDKEDNLAKAIANTNAHIVIDFTPADVAYQNTKTIIECNAHPVIGSSGINAKQLKELQAICREKKLGGIIAPNFSIAAVLMMQFSAEAAKYLPNVEIIEMHHDQKPDAPSGTAIKTAEMIAPNKMKPTPKVEEKEVYAGARGGKVHDIPIHSIRLPGIFAQQTVIFGNSGETLTIHHDAKDRNAMMPGVILACRKVTTLNHLVYGLENVINLA